eukprot:s7563_g4.t1
MCLAEGYMLNLDRCFELDRMAIREEVVGKSLIDKLACGMVWVNSWTIRGVYKVRDEKLNLLTRDVWKCLRHWWPNCFGVMLQVRQMRVVMSE